MSRTRLFSVLAFALSFGSTVFAASNQETLMSCEPIRMMGNTPPVIAQGEILKDNATGMITMKPPQFEGDKSLEIEVSKTVTKSVPQTKVKEFLKGIVSGGKELCQDVATAGQDYSCTKEHQEKLASLVLQSSRVKTIEMWQSEHDIDGFMFTQMLDKNGKPVVKLVHMFAMGSTLILCK